MSVISFGISFLVNKLLSPKDPKQVKTSSYIFSSKDNVTNRNTPVPVSYGRLRIGSHVISSITLNFDLAFSNNQIQTTLIPSTAAVGFSNAYIK